MVIQTGELLPPCAAGQAAFLPAVPPGVRDVRAPPMMRPCSAPPFRRRALAAVVSDEASAALERAREAWVQNRAAAEALAVAAARAAAEAAAGAVGRHVTHIADNLLTPKCPRCDAAFVDFEGCFALACGRRECGENFCGWCMAGFGKGGRQATHAHVLECPQSLERGSYYSTEQKFAQALRTRAIAAIPRYLDVAVGLRGVAANARLRDQVVERLRPMLRMHNIEPRQVC